MKNFRIQFIAFIALMVSSQLCMTLNRNQRGGQGAAGNSRRDGWRGDNGAAGVDAWGNDTNSGRRRGGNRSRSGKRNISASDVAGRIRRLEEENRRIRTNNSILGYELEDLNKNNDMLRVENDRLRVDGEQYAKNLKEIEILRVKINGNQAEIHDLRIQLAKYTDIEKENEALRKRIFELECENTEVESRIKNLQKTIEDLNKRIAELEVQNREIDILKKTISSLTATAAEKDKIISSLIEEKNNSDANIEKLRKEIKYLEEKLNAEIALIAKLRREITEANAKITALNRQIIDLKSTLAKKDKETDEWKAKIKSLEQEIDGLNAQVKKYQELVADREELVQRAVRLQEKLARLQHKLNGHRHGSRKDGWSRRDGNASAGGKKTTIIVGDAK
jgi:chromosome segregation ATPase